MRTTDGGVRGWERAAGGFAHIGENRGECAAGDDRDGGDDGAKGEVDQHEALLVPRHHGAQPDGDEAGTEDEVPFDPPVGQHLPAGGGG